MRVYGALMWSLGKVLNTPEVVRVYIGYATTTIAMHVCFVTVFGFINSCDIFFVASSFNDKPINATDDGPLGQELFEKEQDDLLSDLKDIPKKACDRRVS